MSKLDIVIALIVAAVGLPAAIWFVFKNIERFKKKYKIVGVGFSLSDDYPNKEGFICTVPHIEIEKYDDDLLQIIEAELIFKDRYGKIHRYGPSSIVPNEIKKTETIELGYFYFAEHFWEEDIWSAIYTENGKLTFKIRDGKGKITQYTMRLKKRKLKKQTEESGMGTIQFIDNDGKLKGEKTPISQITMSRKYHQELSKEVKIEDRIEMGKIIEIDNVSYLITAIIVPIPGIKYKECQVCNSKLFKVILVKMSYASSNPENTNERYSLNNWCLKCKKGKLIHSKKLQPSD